MDRLGRLGVHGMNILQNIRVRKVNGVGTLINMVISPQTQSDRLNKFLNGQLQLVVSLGVSIRRAGKGTVG